MPAILKRKAGLPPATLRREAAESLQTWLDKGDME